MQGEVDENGIWDGKNIAFRIKDGMVSLSNKKQNKTNGRTVTLYKNGIVGRGFSSNGNVHGKTIFTKPDGSSYEKLYEHGRKTSMQLVENKIQNMVLQKREAHRL